MPIASAVTDMARLHEGGWILGGEVTLKALGGIVVESVVCRMCRMYRYSFAGGGCVAKWPLAF